MMAKTRIQPVSKTKTIDYSNEIINNFWLKKNIQSNYQNRNDNLQKIISVFKDVQDTVICIQTEQIDHPEIVKAIFNATQKRNRIYILTNKKDEQLKQLTGSCLIRYGIKNIGSFVLIAPNTDNSKGIIYTAPMLKTSLANADNIILDLDNEQIKILFRFFSDNFWNKAEFEIIEDYNNPQKTDEPPLDFFPNVKDFCDDDFVREEIKKINKAALISVPNLQTNEILNLTELKNSAILTNLKNNDNDLLKIITGNKNSITSIKQNTNRIIISDNKGWLIPKTNISDKDNFFALKLNSKQIEFLEDFINDRIDNAEFEFYLSKSRAELKNKTIILLDDIEKEVVINSESDKSLDNIELKELLSKEEFEKQEPEFKDDKVSVKINYSWEIIPFYTPDNAQKAKLYEEWEEKYQKEYKSFINQIEIAINESESKNIGEKLKRWFLGKKQTILKYKQELEEIKDVQLSILEVSKRKDIVKRVNELAKNVSVNLSEINTEIKKSKIEEEIEQLRQEKQKKEDEFEKWKAEQERILKEKKEKKEKRLQEFLNKYNIKKESLAAFRNDLERKAGKKNRKKNPEEVQKVQKILEELKEIQGFDFSKKYEDEKRKFEKEIKNLETKLSSKEKELTKVGKEQKENEGSSLNYAIGEREKNKKKTKSNNEFDIPDTIEFLPKVGELFELKNQRYLEIEYWEDFELGLEEAKRLNAKLSAKQN